VAWQRLNEITGTLKTTTGQWSKAWGYANRLGSDLVDATLTVLALRLGLALVPWGIARRPILCSSLPSPALPRLGEPTETSRRITQLYRALARALASRNGFFARTLPYSLPCSKFSEISSDMP
jgi:hypothetical protein